MALGEVRIVDDPAALKALADPLRLKLLEHLDAARSVKDVAAALGVRPNRLYYHLRLLERHGLVRVVDERVVSGIVERRYEAVPFAVSPELRLPATVARDVTTTVLDVTQREIAARAAAGSRPGDAWPGRAMVLRAPLTLNAEQREEVRARIEELLERYTIPGETPPGAGRFTLVVALYEAEEQ